eukprot:2824516-Amphidinium_carterae.1
MRGQRKQKPETEIVREGSTAIKKATPPTGINPVPLPPPPKAKQPALATSQPALPTSQPALPAK